jgi:hypothetical protein
MKVHRLPKILGSTAFIDNGCRNFHLTHNLQFHFIHEAVTVTVITGCNYFSKLKINVSVVWYSFVLRIREIPNSNLFLSSTIMLPSFGGFSKSNRGSEKRYLKEAMDD